MKIQHHHAVTLRLFGDECAVITWRDGRRRALDGALGLLVHRLDAAGLFPRLVELASEPAYLEASHPGVGRLATEDQVHRDAMAAVLGSFEPPKGLAAGKLNDLLSQAPRLWEHARKERVPLFALLELTYKCNLRCTHCYVLHRVEEPVPSRLDENTIVRTIDELVSLGCVNVSLSGGEPTLVRGYTEYISSCKDNGLYTTLKTNGTTFTRQRAMSYARDPAHETHLSLYGAKAPTHDDFTKIPGSFERTLVGLRRLASAGIKCKVNCTVWRGNACELGAIQHLIDGLEHEVVFDDIIHGRLNGDMAPLALRLTASDKRRLAEEGLLDGTFSPSPCTAGIAKVKVGADGAVSTCELLPAAIGNINENSLTSVWRSPEFATAGVDTVRSAARATSEGRPHHACPGLNLLTLGRADPAPVVGADA